MVAPAKSTATPTQQSLPLDTPVSWHERLHGDQRGTVLLWHPAARGRRNTKIEPDHPYASILSHRAGTDDVFGTPNEFHGWRLVRLLKSLRAVWVDIDNPDKDPWEMLEIALARLEHERYPPPTIAIHSGGGLHLYWILEEPTPARALPYWQAIQRTLIRTLDGDPKASDCSRVMRIPGTCNGKRGGVQVRGQIISDELWTLDDLGREILPYTRAEIRDINAGRAARKGAAPATTKGIASWWYRVYTDIITIQEHHWFGGVAEGQRDNMLFLASVALSYYVHTDALRSEIAATARTLTPSLTADQAKSYTSTVVNRALQEGADVKTGLPRDPRKHRYRFKKATLRGEKWLGPLIVPELEPQLTGLACDEVLAERHRERDRQRRRDAGAIPRAEYEAQSAARQEPWEALGMSRATWYRRGKPRP